MKLLAVLLISLFLCSCAVLFPQPKLALLQDQQNFCLAFDDFQKHQRLDGLRQLRVDFPKSVWAARAETIILYVQKLDQCKAQNEILGESGRVKTLELDQLKQLNLQLTEQIEKLTSLLIELEQHPQ